MSLLSLLIAVAALACFASATEDHHRRWLRARATPERRRRRRRLAWALLAASAPPAILTSGWVVGPILWSGIVMLAAGSVFLLLNLWPRRPPGEHSRRR